ncbi:MAG TPA: malto-oligosyltrehalose synthase [Longimicrobiales bacterium]|nr:malto-oligosyltrehalose synthase [Longimicrobiales bacterium]
MSGAAPAAGAEPRPGRRTGPTGPPPSVPRATYRVQLTPGWGFDAAADVAAYLADLGVSHLYSSPILTARTGSEHGYDGVDTQRLDGARGGEPGFARLRRALDAVGLGLLVDIVPNHMAASQENAWWWDVLQHGPASRWARHFDIDWWPPHMTLRAAVLLPVLGAPYGRVLEDGQLRLVVEEGSIQVAYFDRRLPLDPATVAPLLEAAAAGKEGELGTLARALTDLPPREAAHAQERARRAAPLLARLATLLDQGGEAAGRVRATVERWNGQPGEPGSFDRLDALLGAQPWRLAFWKVAAEEINYRRFFDIADLVSMRVEREDVFRDAHAGVLRLSGEGALEGLRVDHIDGLRDPEGYLEDLDHALEGRASYRLVEKILAPDEELPEAWRTHGTTGYDFLNALNAIFVDAGGLTRLDGVYAGFIGRPVDFDTLLRAKKRQVLGELFGGELRSLAHRFTALARADRHGRDLPSAAIERALLEVSASLGVYRTYWRGWQAEPDGMRPQDRARVDAALAAAHGLEAEVDEAALAFVGRVLTPGAARTLPREAWEEAVLRWQQLTGPATAKGLEDTTLYLFNRLVSMNAVGSEPGEVDVSLDGFHAFLARRAERWPATMNTTSTHDSKRSEDVRARINVLSELADTWAERLAAWAELNRDRKERVGGALVPDANTEVLFYQTLLGSWPLEESRLEQYPERIRDFMVKAAREAKVHTAWLAVDEAYETALTAFVDRVLEAEDFRSAFLPLQERVARLGALNALSQVVLKCAAPGVPDFYQGTELWDLSLVDPDNRRPVDFEARSALLERLGGEPAGAAHLLADWRSGAIKLDVTRRCLAARAERPGLFAAGSYQALETRGARGRSVVAFLRAAAGQAALVCAGVRLARAAEAESWARGPEAWGGTELRLPAGGPGRWRDALTDRRLTLEAGADVPLGEIFRDLPCALLLSED